MDVWKDSMGPRIYLGDAKGRGGLDREAMTPEKKPLRLLLSYHYFRDDDIGKLIAECFHGTQLDLFADSGAYSAYTTGTRITVQEYAEWLRKWGHLFTCAAALDVIGSAKDSYEQTGLLRNMVDPKLPIIPIFHSNDEADGEKGQWNWLTRYLDDGYDYIGISPTGNIYSSPKWLQAWLARCFKMARPGVRYHGFGVTGWKVLLSFPWYSVDSSSWTAGFRFASLQLFDEQRGRMEKIDMRQKGELLKFSKLLGAYGVRPTQAGNKDYDRDLLVGACVDSWRRRGVADALLAEAPQHVPRHHQRGRVHPEHLPRDPQRHRDDGHGTARIPGRHRGREPEAAPARRLQGGGPDVIKIPDQERMPLGVLVMADYNPRQMADHEMEALIAGFREFGFVDPVVARYEDNLLIGGHQRIEALKTLLSREGWDAERVAAFEVPVMRVKGLTESQTRKLNLALNRIHGDWNYTALAEVLQSITDLERQEAELANLEQPDASSLDVTGFSPNEVEDIMRLASGPTDPGTGGNVDPDEEHRRDQRRFRFEVEDDEQAKLCWSVLKSYGLTGPGDSGKAFLAALTAAQKGASA